MLDVAHSPTSEVVRFKNQIQKAVVYYCIIIITSNGVADAVVSLIANEKGESDEASGHVHGIALVVRD